MDEFSDFDVNEIVSMRQGLYPDFKETKKSKEGLRFYEVPSYLKDRMDEKSTKEFPPEDLVEQIRSSLAKIRNVKLTREEQLVTHTASEAIERRSCGEISPASSIGHRWGRISLCHSTPSTNN